jgi:hypothetical protein
MIPQDQIGEIQYLTNGSPIAGLDDPAYVYNNQQDGYTSLRVPDSAAGPGTIWLADDISLGLPNGNFTWDITAYGYMTYGFGGTAPYDVHSALYRFDACTSSPVPLVDWYTGDCCVDPEEIAGTGTDITIPWDGMVTYTYTLPAVVNIERDVFMYLNYSGDNVADNAGWIIAGSCDDKCDVGFTDDFWVEEIDGVGCGLFWFGGDPYSGFRAFILGESAAVFDMMPETISGTGTIVGNVATLDCNDLPQDVDIAVYARDWAPMMAKGWQTQISCDSYYTTAGTLTAINVADADGAPPWDPFSIRIENDRADYIFTAGFGACNNITPCPDGVNGAYSCLFGALSAAADDGTTKYMNHYPFTVGADTVGFWEISLDCETCSRS